MALPIDEKDTQKFVIIGDKVLISPKAQDKKSKTGLYLPPGVHEKETVYCGYIVKTGPGYPLPNLGESEELWKKSGEIKYLPLQVKVGDLAIYLQKSGIDISFNSQKYILISQSDILMVVRDEGLFE